MVKRPTLATTRTWSGVLYYAYVDISLSRDANDVIKNRRTRNGKLGAPAESEHLTQTRR